MKISDAIRSLILLRKPIPQPEPPEEMNLEQINNDASLVDAELIQTQFSDTQEKV